MAIVANNIVVTGRRNVPPPVIERHKLQTTTETVVEQSEHYHEMHDGDLHRKFNKKSEYLVDMAALKD